MLDLLSLYGREANQKNNWRLDNTKDSAARWTENVSAPAARITSFSTPSTAHHDSHLSQDDHSRCYTLNYIREMIQLKIWEMKIHNSLTNINLVS